MNKLSIKLENCYGIEKLIHDFDFSEDNVFSIYARNGLMKTSLAKTFRLIQDGNEDEAADAIFEINGKVDVSVDGKPIEKEQVFVIKSYESSYESDISPLLVKGEIQEQLKEVFEARTKLLKALEKSSGLKTKRISGGKTILELEPQIIEDFGLKEKSILLCLDELKAPNPDIFWDDIQYSSIFDATVIKKIKSAGFQKGIKEFTVDTDKIYDSFEYLEKGKLTLPKLKDLRKSLEKDSFFIKNNKVTLSGVDPLVDIKGLDIKISEIEEEIKQSPAFQEIEKMLSDAKGMILKDIIETHPDIVEFLSLAKLGSLRKMLWKSYLKKYETLLNELINKYQALSEAIDAVKIDDTPWKQALDIFNQRFSVPFSMSVANLKGAVIGESIPQVEFTFKRGTQRKTINRSKLEELNTLSRGEQRALYLLNIIFDVEQLKKSGKEVVIIVDDIADSFDYKNKYAIIEYLYEMSKEPNFYIIILSHNFDFYRAVSNRLGIEYNNKLAADLGESTLSLSTEEYQKGPFNFWRNNINKNKKYILALIPFVRNLIEFGVDRQISTINDDFLYMTLLLHEKNNSRTITFADIEPLYKEYIGIENFGTAVNLNDCIIDEIYSECDVITKNDTKLENKIILAIGIRHKAEEYMLREINAYTGNISWKKGKQIGLNSEFLTHVANSKNQTRELLEAYRQFGTKQAIVTLDEVGIMTPENIHLNSFMYEPLLDMDITELLSLYSRVKAL